MTRSLLFTLSLIGLASCEKQRPDLTSVCAGYTRSESVSNVLATVNRQRVSGQPTGNYSIVLDPISYRSYTTSLAPCNLPQQFQKDTLSIIISGYKLTRPDSQTVKTTEQPFEITDIQLKK